MDAELRIPWQCSAEICLDKRRFSVDASMGIFLCFLLLSVPVNWVLSSVCAAMVHELFHMAAVRLGGGKIRSLRIGVFGTRIDTDPMTGLAEFVSILAGPAGSFLLMLFYPWIPRIAICAGVQGLFNLLPIYPLDGGRLLRCLPLPEKTMGIIEQGTGILLLASVIAFAAVYRYAFLPVCFVAGIGGYRHLRKRPCKHRLLRLQ